MRILVISDIHANYTALEAVLADAGQVDETWCLGDMVGYGPDPNACVEELRDLPMLTCLLKLMMSRTSMSGKIWYLSV